MVFVNWWMLLIWTTIVIVVGAMVWKMRHRLKGFLAHDKRAIPIAHSERIRKLPSYKKFLHRYMLGGCIAIGLSCLLLIAAIVLSMRPVSVTVQQPDTHNRDIMLCLDISGSMSETDSAIMKTFAGLAGQFKGERVGFVAFDSTASTVFPLTDDYSFIKEELTSAAKDLEASDYLSDIYTGTSGGVGSSLIGDGFASCVLRFDKLDVKRSRSVILATDNYVSGAQIVTFPEAGALAKEKNIRVYGINPADASISSDDMTTAAKEFHDVTIKTGGGYYKINYSNRGDTSVVGSIVDNISKQEATRFKGEPQLVQSDVPDWFAFSAFLMLCVLCLIAWRVRQ